jgi:hypothetical protein
VTWLVETTDGPGRVVAQRRETEWGFRPRTVVWLTVELEEPVEISGAEVRRRVYSLSNVKTIERRS